MPYKDIQDLPDSIQSHLPKAAQDIYREAFNHAYEEYKDPHKRRIPTESLEEISHRVAWAAVKRKYIKNVDGAWELKE